MYEVVVTVVETMEERITIDVVKHEQEMTSQRCNNRGGGDDIGGKGGEDVAGTVVKEVTKDGKSARKQ